MGHIDTPIARRHLRINEDQPEWLTGAREFLAALTPPPPAPTDNTALVEARAGLCAHTGGPDGACSETIKRIDAALRAMKGENHG